MEEQRLEAALRRISRLEFAQKNMVRALDHVKYMFDLLDREIQHSDLASLTYSTLKHELESLIFAEALRQHLPLAMTERLRAVLTVLVESGETFVSIETIAHRSGLQDVGSLRKVLSWLEGRDPILRNWEYNLLEEKSGEGYRLQPHLRFIVQQALGTD